MIDILEIRDRLNQMPFRQGQRQVFIGRISEAVSRPEVDQDSEEEDEPVPIDQLPEAREYLARLETALSRYDLSLVRDGEDRDALYAMQKLRSQTEVDMSWMRDAVYWTSRITTVALEMIVPAIIGYWLDNRFRTGSTCTLVGLICGMVLGFWHLLQMTKAKNKSSV